MIETMTLVVVLAGVVIIAGRRGDRLMELHHALGHSSSDSHGEVMNTAIAARSALDRERAGGKP